MKFHYKVTNIEELENCSISIHYRKKLSTFSPSLIHLLSLFPKTTYRVTKYVKRIAKPLLFFYHANAVHNYRYGCASTTMQLCIPTMAQIEQELETGELIKMGTYSNTFSNYYRNYSQKDKIILKRATNDFNFVRIPVLPEQVIQSIRQFIANCEIYEIEVEVSLMMPSHSFYRDIIERYYQIESIF